MEKLYVVVAVAFVVAMLIVMGVQINECNKAGGTLVRGLFLFECIK